LESADLPPIVGAVCFGVGRKTGPMTVKLNRFGWTWHTTGLTPTGYFNLTETVTLTPGGRIYTGTFDFKPYDVNGNFESGQGRLVEPRSAVRTGGASPSGLSLDARIECPGQIGGASVKIARGDHQIAEQLR
jgi:hypothetical protein